MVECHTHTHIDYHTHTHISSNLTILPHLLSSILVYQSPSLSPSVSAGSLVSTGSLSCTRSQPSLFFRSRIIWPPQGKLVYFWAGLTRYKPYCALYSFSALVLPFPHIYLMSPFISFTHFQFLPQLLLLCNVAITDTWAPLLSYQPSSTGTTWLKGWSPTGLTKIFSSLSPLPPMLPPL